MTNSLFHRFRVGGIECVALSDGAFPRSRPPDTPPDAPVRMLQLSCLLVLLPGTGHVLMDAGFGPDASVRGERVPGVGRVIDALAQVRVTPEMIDVVLISHLHPDHIGGLYGRGGTKLYPNARYRMAAQELAFWSAEPVDFTGLASPPPLREAMIAAAKTVLENASGMLETFKAGDEALPGIGTIWLPGHSPGQVGYVISDGGETLMFTADAIAEAVASVETPDQYNPMDMDPDLAVRTRHDLIDRLSLPGQFCFSPHFEWPSLGRIRKSDGRAFFEPAS